MDEKQSSNKVPVIPALLITSALHNRLIKENLKPIVTLLLTQHQLEITINSVPNWFWGNMCSSMAGLQSILKVSNEPTELTSNNCVAYRKCLNKGLLKIMSKMGISNVSSYRGSGYLK